MGKFRIVLTGAVAAGMISVTPVVAQADTATRPSAVEAPQPFSALADGFLYASAEPYGQGAYCRWLNNSEDWGVCTDAAGNSRNMKNEASQMWNNGVPGPYDDVKVFWDTSHAGAWRCLTNGSHWDNLPLGRETFNGGGSSARGYGQSLNNNVASHMWVDNC
ncbi:hypothetical protein LG634_00155 [Streptomyces bambusae]|uniref:hypothetical protein n=1 Tax=Streptomyces bambusae TaxID=1550616 RepID=UPI001CFCFB80|nr:hypothetical protein [Streptomyces bambusae]MCB5163268.1 hypothetical protein [Streptomyces bambusae]